MPITSRFIWVIKAGVFGLGLSLILSWLQFTQYLLGSNHFPSSSSQWVHLAWVEPPTCTKGSHRCARRIFIGWHRLYGEPGLTFLFCALRVFFYIPHA